MTIAQPHGRIAITGGPLVLPDRIASGQAVIVEGGQILGIIAAGEVSALSALSEIVDVGAGSRPG